MDVLDRHGKLVTRYTEEVTGDEAAAAVAMLAGLRVRADDWRPTATYDRTALPLAWAKIARLGMDMKDVLLARAMAPATTVFDCDGYTLRHGELDDPYTGKRLIFDQVPDRAEFRIELDHVVSLADAFCSGGYRWSPNGYNWQNLYNDPGNLLAVSKNVNQSKGSRNAAAWLPIDEFRQRFVIMQIQVKVRYRLSVTQSEATTMREVLGVA